MKKSFEQGLIKESLPQLFNVRKIPKQYRDDVQKLYSFFYIMNNYSNPSTLDASSLKTIIRRWQGIKRDDLFANFNPLDDSINERIISNIAYLINRYDVDTRDVDDYLRSLAIIVRKKQLQNTQDLVRYLHYSAEAPALITTKVLKLPNALAHHAKMYARATRMLSILTAISAPETELLLPKSEVKKFGLSSLSENEVRAKPDEFNDFIQLQLKRYTAWQDESKKGDEFLPKKLKPIVKKARSRQSIIVAMINKNPMCLYDSDLKLPSRAQLMWRSRVRRK